MGIYKTQQNPTMVSYAKKYPHVNRALGAFGRDFIKESAASDQPFCLLLSFKAPHKPHDEIDPVDQKLYAGVTFPAPPGFAEEGRTCWIGRSLGRKKSWGGLKISWSRSWKPTLN